MNIDELINEIKLVKVKIANADLNTSQNIEHFMALILLQDSLIHTLHHQLIGKDGGYDISKRR